MNVAAPMTPRRIRCAECGHLLLVGIQDCIASCTQILEIKCRSCAAMLLIRRGRTVEVSVPGTR